MPEPVQGVGVKICGLTRREDASLAAREGADYLGVVLVPGTPRFLTPARAARVVGDLGRPTVCVLADPTREEAVEAAREVGARVLQLHGRESRELLAFLREAGPWEIWKAIRVRKAEEVGRAAQVLAGVAHGLLLDGWHPTLRGGAGVGFSWEGVARLRDRIPPELRLIAAGGLNPGNVATAVAQLRPELVDVSSGVEGAPGIKDPDKIRDFIRAARGGHLRIAESETEEGEEW